MVKKDAAGADPSGVEAPWAETAWRRLWSVVHRITGLDFSTYRQTIIRRRVETWLVRNNLPGPEQTADYLTERPRLAYELVAYATVDVSDFFRNRAVFEFLASEVLPRYPNRWLRRVLCLGCGRGQECYSVAMLLDRLGIPGQQARVIGVDIDGLNLHQAATGCYNDRELRGLSDVEKERYWTRESKTSWKARRSIGGRVHFIRASIFDLPLKKSTADVVFCRNVLIFILPTYHDKLFETIHGILKPGGILVLGGVERVPQRWADAFETLSMVHHVFRRREVFDGK